METPPFNESVTSFKRFAGDQGLSTELVWVFREDVTNCIRDYWVRMPVPTANESLARDYFEYGRGQGRGVTLEVLCRLGRQTLCYVWVPEDDVAASHAMQGGSLHYKTPTQPVEATIVRSALKWHWLQWTHWWRRCVRGATMLPLRKETERLTGHRT